MEKFKIITLIDRVNFISDTYINYYSKIFEKEEFYFLVQNTQYDIIEPYLIKNGFKPEQLEKIYKTHLGFGDTTNRCNTIQETYLKEGFTVVYVDIDELIYHNDLRNFILNSKDELFCPFGLKIFQHPDEDFLDTTKTICSQRNYVSKKPHYSKICVLRKYHHWQAGRHNNNGLETPFENEFYLIDIGDVSRDIVVKNHGENKNIYNVVRKDYQETRLEAIRLKHAIKYKNYIEMPKILKEKNLF